MTIEFKLPELGENVASGDIVNVLVQVGQPIEANQGVFEIETEKAVVEIPCPHAGKVTKIHVKKGDRVKVGETLLSLEAETEAPTAAAPKAPSAAQEAVQTPAKPAVHDGVQQASAPMTKAPRDAAPPSVAPPTMQPAGVIPAGPAARRVARELGVDIQQVQGSGQRGRITREDVEAAATSAVAPAADWAVEPVIPPGEESNDAWGKVRRERLSQIRRAIAAQMARSSSTIPHVTNFDDADVTDLEQLRKSVPANFLGENVKLTSMPFVMKAVAMALRRHPLVNSSLDEQKEEIVYKQYVNLGVAVDTPRGLVVPVVRNADRMSIAQLAQAVAAAAEKARSGRFALEEVRGGTFTISNMGAVGGAYSTPIINHPEATILLLGRSRWLPVVRDDRIEKRYLLPLSLSYDHRLVDGATAARFLNEVIGYLQAPATLLMS
jgi:pyruvate dehydrogenase E2 component (dihydrolipoamide acetyltransferase)